MKEEGRGSGSELGSDLDLNPDPWKILWIRIRQNDAYPLDPDPDNQLCFKLYIGTRVFLGALSPSLFIGLFLVLDTKKGLLALHKKM